MSDLAKHVNKLELSDKYFAQHIQNLSKKTNVVN